MLRSSSMSEIVTKFRSPKAQTSKYVLPVKKEPNPHEKIHICLDRSVASLCVGFQEQYRLYGRRSLVVLSVVFSLSAAKLPETVPWLILQGILAAFIYKCDYVVYRRRLWPVLWDCLHVEVSVRHNFIFYSLRLVFFYKVSRTLTPGLFRVAFWAGAQLYHSL